jgi:isocitrate lyase
MVKPAIQEKSPYKITIGKQVCIKCSAMSLTHVKLVWFDSTGAALESVKKFNFSNEASY